MSETAVLEVVTRARNDEAFRKLLLTNPKAAFAGYDLTDAEKEKLRNLNEIMITEGSQVPESPFTLT
ncbi:MAG: Os1348 family NHLP clan protein [Anaerolineae bacterium]|nr:Os1348 family NHLP clan protein [Anaerolineae bacterium]MCO5189076.1 Os1348 family NHLP clan protein [Anaerolineae bacterium]MCO5195745.1 Os1348 family NHLP clan protein [Anaerolineae bacterium]MCO5199521.1 Os1348 family NHLP clan protein [Anaerolineae bacterium]MCO5206928.1 Os1348 family NHLP clan protein [Anaerolineae bacterium]